MDNDDVHGNCSSLRNWLGKQKGKQRSVGQPDVIKVVYHWETLKTNLKVSGTRSLTPALITRQTGNQWEYIRVDVIILVAAVWIWNTDSERV